MEPNPDQLAGIDFIKNWFHSPKQFALIQGEAGTGKTFMLDEALRQLKATPLLTAPTNEAVHQIGLATNFSNDLSTTYSAFGYYFDNRDETKSLKKLENPPSLNKYNLIVIDEGSMITDFLLETAKASEKKILVLLHRSQLPPPKKVTSILDKCESPIFQESFPTFNLTTQMRNTGEGYKFCKYIESFIYNSNRPFKCGNFGSDLKKLFAYIKSSEGTSEFQFDRTKLICWSNETVDAMNKVIRENIYGETDLPKFIVGDKILFTSTVNLIGNQSKVSEKEINKIILEESIETNTKAEITAVTQTTIFEIACYKLAISTDKKLDTFVYVPLNLVEFEEIKKAEREKIYHYFGAVRQKAWIKYHKKFDCFANIKHSYALTAYRCQGMTIPKVIVNWGEISKDPIPARKYKMGYVAASRHRDELEMVR